MWFKFHALCSFFVFILKRHFQSFREVILLTLSFFPLVSSPVGKKKNQCSTRNGDQFEAELCSMWKWWKSAHRGVFFLCWCCRSPAEFQPESRPWIDSVSTRAFKNIFCHCKLLLPCVAKKMTFNSTTLQNKTEKCISCFVCEFLRII